MKEKWAKIPPEYAKYPEFLNYEFSTKGRVRNEQGHIMKLEIGSTGYYRIRPYVLMGNKKKRTVLPIHRGVLLAHNPIHMDYEIVDHIDGNRLNNNIDNLRWVTYRENRIYALQNRKNKSHVELTNDKIAHVPVIGHEDDYEIFKDGRAFSKKTGKFMKLNRGFYRFRKDNKESCCSLSRLLMEHFGIVA